MLFKNLTAHVPKALALGTMALGLYSQATLAATGVNCANWVSGDNYVTGNIVIYQGGYYIAEHDNPGYIPTVSTWFWDPTTSAACGSSSSSVGSFTKLVEAESYTNMSGV